jgi:hypothetical protein
MTYHLPGIATFVGLALLIFRGPQHALIAQSQNGISEPGSGEVVSGIVLVKGYASHPDFLRYELAFFQESRPQDEWVVFAQGEQPVLGGTLAVWDTTVGGEFNPVFPDGQYRLRLRVVKKDYNYDEFFVTSLTIANGPLSTTETAEPPGGAVEMTPTPPNGTALAATLQANTGALPSLTPFPTPSPQATPESADLGVEFVEQETGDGNESGLFGQIAAIDIGQFGRAFLLGVRLVALAFIALAVYLLLRVIVRRLWRYVRTKTVR